MGWLEVQVQTELTANPEARGRRASPGKPDRLDNQGLRVIEDPMVPQGFLDLLDHQDPLVKLGYRVKMDSLGTRATEEPRVSMVCLVQPVCLEISACKDLRAFRVSPDLLAQREPQGIPVIPVQSGPVVSQVYRAL